MKSNLAHLLLCCVIASSAAANEVHSNGLGGGRWSEASTWRGGVVPSAEDDAVIAARDTVLFDRDDAENPTCKQLILDPNSNLAFQSGLGKRTLTVNGPVELYGSLKMHAPGPTDEMEIRLAAESEAERAIKLQRGGALLVLGRADMPDGKRNATISVSAPPIKKVPATGELTAVARTMIDLQNAHVDNVAISAANIDNTGAKPNERCNIVGNLFTGYARLAISLCDTPAIVKNEFIAQKAAMVRPGAIAVISCPLADVRGNRVVGAFAIGISIMSSEGSATGNTVSDCPQGIVWHTGPCMLKQNTIRNCKAGLSLRTVTGSVEDTFIDGCEVPLLAASAKVQITTVVITNPPKSPLLEMTASSVGLLNCNISPDQIKSTRDGTLPKNVRGEDPVEAMEFLVVGVKGTVPPLTKVELLTASPAKPLAPGASDLNIRNSPAAVRPDGLTALPQSLTPIIVKSWRMEDDRKIQPAPEYTLNVLGPATEAGAKPHVLKSMKVKPDEKAWFRAKPNEAKATLEIQVP